MHLSGIGSNLLKGGQKLRNADGLLRVRSYLQRRSLSLKPDLSKFKLTPPPPGGVVGTPNDSFKPPEPDHFHGSYHWDYERITAASLLPLTTIPLYITLTGGAVPPLLDAALGAVLLLHVQQGITSCIIDYIPKRKFGIWHDFARYLLYGGSALGLYGVYELETSNNGIVDLLVKILKEDESHLYFSGSN